MEQEQEIRERSRELEAATIPAEQPQVLDELKRNLNDSLELFSDKLLQLENEVAELKSQRGYDGSLSENDILKVIGVILSNDKLSEYLGQKIRDKFRDKVKVNFEIG